MHDNRIVSFPFAGRARLLAFSLFLVGAALSMGKAAGAGDKSAPKIDFNRDIGPVLSNACFQCHGPDARKRKGVNGPLRLDTEEGALKDLGGYAAIVKGKPDESELIRRITSDDPNEKMPPASTGKPLSPHEVELLTEWVRLGAPYAKHWSYTKPVRPELPEVKDPSWPKNPVDRFILARLGQEGLKPSPEADKYTLIRRLSLDLTGLPPSLEEVDEFVNDRSADAYEKLVDRLLAKPSYGEHWARLWLDLARYADSAGYADDPPRTIWGYRDYVIRSFNANKPFDEFTIEQIAGDLLPNPTHDQLIATAFHRNTLTNNEGGTNDEEFRNVAVVDRVNTTMAVWMGTTMACAQCHDHKYDPLKQEEYFKLFAFFNNTGDADRTDESPVLALYTDARKKQRTELEQQITSLETKLHTPTPELLSGQAKWEQRFATEPKWQTQRPSSPTAKSGTKLAVLDDFSLKAEAKEKTDAYSVPLSWSGRRMTALRLNTLADDSLPGKGPGHGGGNFVVSRVHAAITPPEGPALTDARYVRVVRPGARKVLSLAEVEVFRGIKNVAALGVARQSSTAGEGAPARAIDGKTDGRFGAGKSTTQTEASDDPWWEVDLKSEQAIDRVVVWNRTDDEAHTRLSGMRVILLNEKRQPVWTQTIEQEPAPRAELNISGVRTISFTSAYAHYSQPSFEAASVVDNTDPANRGWAIGGQTGQPHALTLVPATPVEIEPGSVVTVTIEQLSKHDGHTLGRFALASSEDERAPEFARTPAKILASLKAKADERPESQRKELTEYYLTTVAPELKETRERLASLKRQLAELKPDASVPIMQELASDARRKTKIQHRGNFLDVGAEVSEGVPAAFQPLPADAPRNRLGLARWLVDENNPLTARVIANRYWEELFGIGIVSTSEEFGAQGELPSHPELLDWLATELVAKKWDLKQFLKLIVTSAAYRQTSRVTPELLKRDPDNRLLARGPRYRLPAEVIRDQALFVAGLLSTKMYGPPVKPPQPSLGLNAAFGGKVDWETSQGEDRYRRGIYTTWRRSSPYPSMATFDAPNREVCTLRRSRTNTPLQALVTLNDPVYVEAAQALARRVVKGASNPEEKARLGFRLCLVRPPSEAEVQRLVQVFESTRESFARDPERAKKMATDPLGPAPKDADMAEVAAWTVVGNVLLNLDETLMTR